MATQRMWKTSIVIWTDYNPSHMELATLAREAESGDAFCAKMEIAEVQDVQKDPDWAETDFFGSVDD